jgi:hypothetical protein
LLLGRGGQSLAERELGWDHKTTGKGIKELKTGIRCIDNFLWPQMTVGSP